MSQVTLWNGLSTPGITAVVGAGGKTTVIQKLVEYGLYSGYPMVVTTTTRMLASQVQPWQPYYGTSFSDAEAACLQAVSQCFCGAWFPGVEDGKVLSTPLSEVDVMHGLHKDWHIIVEADGAKTKWLKAPKTTEPVIPKETCRTIGVINLQALTVDLLDEWVHNLPLLLELVHSTEGSPLYPQQLAQLIMDEKGLFQYSRGERFLFCTGYDSLDASLVDELLDQLAEADLKAIYLANGYGETCRIKKVLQWR